MRKNSFTRVLSLLLSLALVIPMIPVHVMAAEAGSTEAVVSEAAIETAAAAEVSEDILLARDIEARAAKILTQYGVTAGMTDDQIAAAIIAVDGDTLKTTMDEIASIDADAVGLTENAILTMDAELMDTLGSFCMVIDKLTTPMLADATLYDGKLVISSSVTNGGGSGSVSGTASSTAASATKKRATASATVVTFTITNKGATTATVAFGFDITAGDGSTSLSSAFSTGEAKYILSGNGGTATFTVTTTSGTWAYLSNQTTTVTLTNITYVAASDSTSLTLTSNDSKLGSVSSSIAATDGVINVPDAGVTLTASPASGAEFVAWVDGNGNYLSYEESYLLVPNSTLAPDGTMTVRGIFSNGTAWFLAGGTRLYDDLNDAVTFASTASSKIVVLMSSGTLPAVDGGYNILSNVALLIPYADESVAYTNPDTDPERIVEKRDVKGTDAFHTLTLATGATINCSGLIRVDARQASNAGDDSGQINGAYGQIILNDRSSLNMNSGSKLRAYGYITGSGTVNATGATIYELFQMTDWRGGSVVSNVYQSMEDESFLISQYYIQNIESKLVVDASTTMNALVTIAAGLGSPKEEYSSQSVMVGSGGMFILGNTTTMTRTYTSSGRIHYTINGDVSIGSISLKINTGILWVGSGGVITMNSSDYVLNLPSNMTIELADGKMAFPVRAKLLPGTILQIDSGAEVNMSSGAELIVYDYDDWTSAGFTYGGHFWPVMDSAGNRMEALTNGQPGQLIVNGTLNVSTGAAVYSTNQKNTTGNNGLSGKGKIVFEENSNVGRTTIVELTGNNSDNTAEHSVAVTPLQALLKGISTSATDYTHSMANGRTYYGTTDNYWYNFVVNADSADSKAKITLGADVPASGATVTPYNSSTINNALGYVTYDSNGTQSPFSFTVNASCVKAETSNGTLSDSNELTALTEHPTIYLDTEHTNTPSYTDNLDGTHTATYPCCGASDAPVAHNFVGYECVCKAKQTFTVTWKEEGKEDVTSTVNGGEKITLPANPTCEEGYAFVGWFDGNTQATADTICTKDVTYTAKFELKTYTVTWKVEGQEDVTEEYLHGDQIVKPTEAPTKTPAADETCVEYEFAGWSATSNGAILTNFPVAKSDATYYAVFTATPKHTISTEWSKDESGHWHPCTVCGFKFDTAEHTYLNGICECEWQQITDGSFNINATSVRAGYGLDLYFYVDADDVKSYDGCYAKIVRTYADGQANDVKIIEVSSWEKYQGGSLRFCYSNIAAKEMTDELIVTIYSSDGTPLTTPITQSVEDYAVRMIKYITNKTPNRDETNLRTTLVDMLNYGAAAQVALNGGYNLSALANAKIDDYQKFATPDNGIEGKYEDKTVNKEGYLKAASISAETNLKFTFYFKFDSISGYSATARYIDHYGKEQNPPIGNFVTATMTDAIKNESYSVYGVDVPGLAIADGRQIITCKILDSNNKKVTEVESSVESYITKTIAYLSETDETFVAKDSVYFKLMKFIDSAHTYFHPNT